MATEKTRLLVDAGFSRRETYARLAAVGERADRFDALLISHEHIDHVRGLRTLAADLKAPVYLNEGTRCANGFEAHLTRIEEFHAGRKFHIGDIEVTPFSVPHDAADPVAFTFLAEGLRIGLVTDLGCMPETVKQHVRGCHLLILESNHDLDMLKVGPYPWPVKQRVMGRHGHLSNLATAEFLAEDFDGEAEVLVLAHLSENNNHPEIARLTAEDALARRATSNGRPGLHLACQTAPTCVFRF
jgi:phosphoribosyl 1,2-cyclic phosphodiesterase